MKGSIFFLNNIANIGLEETRMVDEAIVVRNTLETKNNMWRERNRDGKINRFKMIFLLLFDTNGRRRIPAIKNLRKVIKGGVIVQNFTNIAAVPKATPPKNKIILSLILWK